MGYSQKGYIDGDLLAEWVKHFDRYTKQKAHGRARYIFLDGHLSRIHLPFLQYCRENNIHALCYPSHSTHIYQGLDVIVFSILKRQFSDEMLQYEAQTGMAVNKSNFLSVYTPAHLRAFTEENIKLAFAKTGLCPFNPDAISVTQLKPSIESSTRGDGLPLSPTTPVRTVVTMLRKAQPQLDSTHPGYSPSTSSTHDAEDLHSTAFGFLISSSPIQPSAALPIRRHILGPPSAVPKDLLSIEPDTQLEARLQECLQELIRREIDQYGKLIDLQASMVLQSVYCERLRSQLFAKEMAKQKKSSGKLLGDGLPRCLTEDEFFCRVQEFVRRQVQEEVERAQRRKEKEDYATALMDWKRLETERKEREKERTRQYAEEMRKWKEEQSLARLEKRKPCLSRPKRGARQPAFPKPTKLQVVDEDVEEIDINVDDSSDDSGMAMLDLPFRERGNDVLQGAGRSEIASKQKTVISRSFPHFSSSRF